MRASLVYSVSFSSSRSGSCAIAGETRTRAILLFQAIEDVEVVLHTSRVRQWSRRLGSEGSQEPPPGTHGHCDSPGSRRTLRASRPVMTRRERAGAQASGARRAPAEGARASGRKCREPCGTSSFPPAEAPRLRGLRGAGRRDRASAAAAADVAPSTPRRRRPRRRAARALALNQQAEAAFGAWFAEGPARRARGVRGARRARGADGGRELGRRLVAAAWPRMFHALLGAWSAPPWPVTPARCEPRARRLAGALARVARRAARERPS